MDSLTFSQLPVMLLSLRNRQLSGTWLEKMCARNPLCHILQEATIKPSFYMDCLDTVTKQERARERKGPFPQSHSLCIKFSFPACCRCQQKDKGSENQTLIKKLIIRGFLFMSFLAERKTPDYYFSGTTQYICVPSPGLFTSFRKLLWMVLFLQLICHVNFFFINVQMKCVQLSCQHL